MTNKDNVKKEREIIKELEYKLHNDNSIDIKTNTAFTVEEAIGLMVDLEIFCCNNLGIHPFMFHTAVQDLLVDVVFNNQPENNIEIIDDNSNSEETEGNEKDNLVS